MTVIISDMILGWKKSRKTVVIVVVDDDFITFHFIYSVKSS